MNRREFTRGLATIGLSPALPLHANAAPIATSAAAERLYFVGWYIARLNKQCSADTLVSELNISKDVAKEIFGKLVETHTVSPPDLFGISRTIDPLTDNYLRAGTGGIQKPTTQPSAPASHQNLPDVERVAPHQSDTEIEDVAGETDVCIAQDAEQQAALAGEPDAGELDTGEVDADGAVSEELPEGARRGDALRAGLRA